MRKEERESIRTRHLLGRRTNDPANAIGMLPQEMIAIPEVKRLTQKCIDNSNVKFAKSNESIAPYVLQQCSTTWTRVSVIRTHDLTKGLERYDLPHTNSLMSHA